MYKKRECLKIIIILSFRTIGHQWSLPLVVAEVVVEVVAGASLTGSTIDSQNGTHQMIPILIADLMIPMTDTLTVDAIHMPTPTIVLQIEIGSVLQVSPLRLQITGI